jgi:AcrR family transcriptional regulator
MVSEQRAGERGYHHGDLRRALVDAGFRLARAGGPSAVLLRAVSREAGVSHNAAYRHFANQEDLVAAVAERCMTQLSRLMIERMERVTVRDRAERAWERLGAIGRAYVDFARGEPGWFRTAFSGAQGHPVAPSPDSRAKPSVPTDGVPGPFALLSERLDELLDVGAIDPDVRDGAEYAAWSSVHGIASLLLDGPLRAVPDAEAERAIGAALGNVSRGLQRG